MALIKRLAARAPVPASIPAAVASSPDHEGPRETITADSVRDLPIADASERFDPSPASPATAVPHPQDGSSPHPGPKAPRGGRGLNGRAKANAATGHRDLFQEATDKVLAAIEEGTAPWEKPWQGFFGAPTNPTTQKPYHGINILLLSLAGFQDPRWCSYEQARKQDWQVRGGEKGAHIYFYKMLQKETGEIDPATSLPIVKTIPVMRSYTVFNLAQMDHDAPTVVLRDDRGGGLDDVAEQAILEIIDGSGATIVYGQQRAEYLPSRDEIHVPLKENFDSDAHYYAAVLHELAHWTGHGSRLNRVFSFDRQTPEYAREELRAEMASAMLSMQLGIPPGVVNHEGYAAFFLTLLRNDKKEIFRAAKDAETICRSILRFSPEHKARLDDEIRDQTRAAAAAGAPEEFFDASIFEDDEGDLRPAP